MTRVRISATVNGVERQLAFDSGWTLVQLLRDGLGLTGTREGCGVGMCGACTVLLDGRLVTACLLLASNIEGRSVLTIEGLADGDRLDPVQQAFLDEGAFQCGFCTPGMILAVKALMSDPGRPRGRDGIREYLSGNICRCGTYAEVLRVAESLGAK